MVGCGGGSSDSPSTAGQASGGPPTSASTTPASKQSTQGQGHSDRAQADDADSGDAGKASGNGAKVAPGARPGSGAKVVPADSPAGREYLRELTKGVATGDSGAVKKQLAEILAKAKRGEFAVPDSSAGSAGEYAEEVLQRVAEGKIGQ